MKSAAVSGSAMLFTPTKRSMHAMKTTPKAGRWWRPRRLSTPIVAAINRDSAIVRVSVSRLAHLIGRRRLEVSALQDQQTSRSNRR